jgi:hypothetical protein
MARAIATCTCDTCGKEFEKIAYKQNRRDANAWEAWAIKNITECPDCYHTRIEKERAAEAAEAAQKAEDHKLPELTGSEKQVAWALRIRQKAIEGFDELLAKGEALLAEEVEPEDREDLQQEIEVCRSARAWYLSEQTTAAWWIDNRDYYAVELILKYQKAVRSGKIKIQKPETAEETEIREAAQAETVAEPENKTHPDVAEITVREDKIMATYAKNDDFRAVLKGLGYSWDADSHAWTKQMTVTTGAPEERAAELGNKLLNAGFAIRIANPDTLRAAVEGRYTPEHQRWIMARTSGDYSGWLVIRLIRGEDLYGAAKAIRSSRYDKPDVVVPASEFAAVEDFATCYDYRISPAAQALIKAARAKVMVVKPAPAKNAQYTEHRPENVLASSADVLADLKD